MSSLNLSDVDLQLSKHSKTLLLAHLEFFATRSHEDIKVSIPNCVEVFREFTSVLRSHPDDGLIVASTSQSIITLLRIFPECGDVNVVAGLLVTLLEIVVKASPSGGAKGASTLAARNVLRVHGDVIFELPLGQTDALISWTSKQLDAATMGSVPPQSQELQLAVMMLDSMIKPPSSVGVELGPVAQGCLMTGALVGVNKTIVLDFTHRVHKCAALKEATTSEPLQSQDSVGCTTSASVQPSFSETPTSPATNLNADGEVIFTESEVKQFLATIRKKMDDEIKTVKIEAARATAELVGKENEIKMLRAQLEQERQRVSEVQGRWAEDRARMLAVQSRKEHDTIEHVEELRGRLSIEREMHENEIIEYGRLIVSQEEEIEKLRLRAAPLLFTADDLTFEEETKENNDNNNIIKTSTTSLDEITEPCSPQVGGDTDVKTEPKQQQLHDDVKVSATSEELCCGKRE